MRSLQQALPLTEAPETPFLWPSSVVRAAAVALEALRVSACTWQELEAAGLDGLQVSDALVFLEAWGLLQASDVDGVMVYRLDRESGDVCDG